jgi:hypothetical protein
MRTVLILLGSMAALALSLPVLLLAAPFLLMAYIVTSYARLTEPKIAPAHSLVKYDPELGWRPSENVDAHYLVRNDDIYPLITDASGWPGSRTLDESRIVVVGDSFAYGYGAGAGESYADLLDDLKPKALASLGYDMVHEVLLLRKYAPRCAGKLVIWWVYLENDLPDNLRPEFRGYRKPFVAQSRTSGDWQIVTTHVTPAPWRNSLPDNNMQIFAHLCAPSALADHYYSACDYLVGEGVAACAANGATLVVMTIPNVNQLDAEGHRFLCSRGVDRLRFDPGYPDQRFEQICARRGVPFVPLMERLQVSDYKLFERFHWQPSGHRKAAAAVREVWEAWRAESLGVAGPERTRSEPGAAAADPARRQQATR